MHGVGTRLRRGPGNLPRLILQVGMLRPGAGQGLARGHTEKWGSAGQASRAGDLKPGLRLGRGGDLGSGRLRELQLPLARFQASVRGLLGPWLRGGLHLPWLELRRPSVRSSLGGWEVQWGGPHSGSGKHPLCWVSRERDASQHPRRQEPSPAVRSHPRASARGHVRILPIQCPGRGDNGDEGCFRFPP